MAAEAKSAQRLLYVAGAVTNTVYVYDYKTLLLVGELTGFDQPSGECVDKKGDVWILNWQSTAVVEYAHGGDTPIRTLTAGDNLQTGCSIDPTTGDLAVSTDFGTLDVWKNARGTPRNYASGICPYFWSPGYDNKGNLFIESSSTGGNIVCELPHGGSSLVIVPFDHLISYPAGAMWDGKYMTFADQSVDGRLLTTGVYQATENASGGLTHAGTTVLTDPCGDDDVVTPFIVGRKNTPRSNRQGTVVIGSNNSCLTNVDFWAYPVGGNPVHVLHALDNVTFGTVVSVKE
jgi:hypothetical protein